MLGIPERILLGIALIAFFVWRIKVRWKRASDYVEGELEDKRTWVKGFDAFKEDPNFKAVKEFIDAKYKTGYDPVSDEETFQVVFAGLFDEKMHYIGLNDSSAKYLFVLIKNNKRKISFTMNLETKFIGENDGVFAGTLVPSWAKN